MLQLACGTLLLCCVLVVAVLEVAIAVLVVIVLVAVVAATALILSRMPRPAVGESAARWALVSMRVV